MSYMRTLERGKVRTQMENQGVKKVSKKLGVWYAEFKVKKHEYIASGAWAKAREKYNNRKRNRT